MLILLQKKPWYPYLNLSRRKASDYAKAITLTQGRTQTTLSMTVECEQTMLILSSKETWYPYLDLSRRKAGDYAKGRGSSSWSDTRPLQRTGRGLEPLEGAGRLERDMCRPTTLFETLRHREQGPVDRACPARGARPNAAAPRAYRSRLRPLGRNAIQN